MKKLRRTVLTARELRRRMSRPEARLWQYLRTRPDGLKFRRQHPLGPFVLDFYCASGRLAVEVDGPAHDMGDNPRRDMARDEWLRKQGVATIRLLASDIYPDMEAAVMLIIAACEERKP